MSNGAKFGILLGLLIGCGLFVGAQQANFPPGGGTPGGSNGQLQYNNNGAFGGLDATNQTINGSNVLTALTVGKTGFFTGTLLVAGGSGAVAMGHLNQNATSAYAGTCTMAAATTCTATIAGPYLSAPLCFAQDQSRVTLDSCALSSSTVTITASASNSTTHQFLLIGNPN